MSNPSIRERFERALAGEPVERPVYAVYDWFVNNRPGVDWEQLFELGLGQINHANLIRIEHPGFELAETIGEQGGRVRRDVRLITDRGELHEWYLDEWRQEHFIKCPGDYGIMSRALEGVQITADDTAFRESEAALGGRGVTVGQIHGLGMGRTPMMVLQIDWVGLERFSIDLALEQPELMGLLEQMTVIKLEEVRAAATTSATHVKLWENMSIETLGPAHYRRHLVPVYLGILDILNPAGKRLMVHYDGQLGVIADDVRRLGFDGIDSFTEPPEGDMSAGEARAAWPGLFLWLHPNLGWYDLPKGELQAHVRRLVREAGPSRFCLMISEEVPASWRTRVPAVLEALE
ncbi:MAG: hypothetical protein HN742_17340 [Lentisphaerae bacterium]|jgi:hypothetical protein|nr:hypothetical protein [Lentisphaerota bacterium]MBT4816675.1 hypothetical protein [Lentisphaerota bacterium]MBT5605666.1 hypothetical protein [Lentisphaerota bacterium]MBT7056315.1 hypothetical protein [Lentisphaerota bacterium]MBT7843646.1 hypothetical protein [Lentisphaerota bacterium]